MAPKRRDPLGGGRPDVYRTIPEAAGPERTPGLISGHRDVDVEHADRSPAAPGAGEVAPVSEEETTPESPSICSIRGPGYDGSIGT